MNLVLVGVRGAGKTTSGRGLSTRLRLRFLDLDTLVEQECGKRIGTLFREEGEAGFRRRETGELSRLRGVQRAVVATGGGAVLSRVNRHLLRALGPVVWLQVPYDEAARRTAQGDRPALTALPPLAEAQAVQRERGPLYERVADATVETGHRSPEQVVDELEQLWHRFLRNHLR